MKVETKLVSSVGWAEESVSRVVREAAELRDVVILTDQPVGPRIVSQPRPKKYAALIAQMAATDSVILDNKTSRSLVREFRRLKIAYTTRRLSPTEVQVWREPKYG